MLPIRRAFGAALAAILFLLAAANSSAQNHLIISQLYGGGGNTGSVYTQDFVELYNPTSAQVNLANYSLQYASATSTTAFSAANTLVLSGTIQPGKFYLIQLAAGTGTGSMGSVPNPDYAPTSGALNLSGTTGKLALVNGTTPLATSCPSAAQATDFVGWGPATGTTANCSYNDSTGANRAPATTNSTALQLSNVPPTWTGVNKNDYSVVTPNPRNSNYSTGSPTTTLSITSSSWNPTSVNQGSPSTISVVVSPGTSTTNIVVTADLSTIGGSATQALALSATNTYSYVYAVPPSTAAASYPIPVKVTSSDPTVSGSAALTVNAATVTTAISTIQANRATYVGTKIQVDAVVTLVTNAGYYLQTPSNSPGSTGDEGIYVYAGSGKVPATIAVGNRVIVNGSLTLYPAATASHTPSLEVTNASVTPNGTAALPQPIALPLGFPNPGGGIYQLSPYESMLVTFPTLTTTSGTGGYLDEPSETVTSNGEFYAVATGTARPFREPGMDFRDYPAATCPSQTNCNATATAAGVTRPPQVVLYDDNPERVLVETSLGGGTAFDVSTGATFTNVTGVVDFTYSTDSPYGDPARLIVRPGSLSAANYAPGIQVQPLALPGAGQVTIAAFNIERFFNTTGTDNKYYNAGTQTVGNSSAVNVTQDAYNRRLSKLSLAIRNVLNAPDVLGLEEVENVSVLKDIAARIDADAVAAGQPAPGYVAYGTDSTTTFTDDIGGISVGFLVKPSTTNVVRWEQIGAQSTFTASSGTQTLNDRPSQVLHVGFKRANGATDYPMTLIVNHLRSLSGIGTSADTRLKKELQAEAVATAVQNYQTAGERVLYFGDMNAFEFSDGYTDTVGTLTGSPSQPGTSAQAGPASPIVVPAATDLVTLLAPADRHSYVEFGNAQVLDHVIATSNVVNSTTLAYAHLNADFPEISTNDAGTPARTSDHDAALTYLSVPSPVISATLTGNGAFPDQMVGAASAGQQFILTNTGEAPIAITSITTSGDFGQSNNCGNSLPVSSTCQINVVFTPTTTGTRTGTLTVTSTATNLSPAALTGNGINTPETVTLGNLSASYDGNPHAATATTSPDNVSVVITYNGSPSAPTAAGSYSVLATVNQTGYSGSASGTLVIGKAQATVTVSNTTATYDGNAHGASVTTTPTGLSTTVTYNGSATAPTAAGSYTVVATITDPNYDGTGQGTLVINKATATVTLGNLNATYDGNAHPASVTTTPAGLSTTTTYNGAATVPTAAGSYAVVATVNDPNYAGSASSTLVINKAAATVALNNLSATYDGNPHTATVTTTPAGLTTNVTYNGATTAPTAAGNYTVVATVTDPNYTGTATNTLVISKATATVTLGNLTATYDSRPHAATATTTPAGLNTTITYNGATTAPTAVGNYTVVATVNDPNYTGSAQGTLTITKGTATVTLSNLSATYDGQAHAATATTTPAGLSTTITYNGSATAPTAVGNYTVVATVNDPNYTGTAQGTLTITKATATVTLSNLSAAYDGKPHAATATTTPAGLSTAITYNGSATAPTAAGSYSVVATVNDANYSGSATGTLVIAKSAPTVTFNMPAAISYGTALSSAQLNATASTSGTFTYTPAAGTVLNAGTQTLSVQFTPSDTTDYSTPAASTTRIVVNPAVTTTTVTTSAATVVAGTSVTFTATVAAASGPVPTGSVIFSDGATALGTVTLTNGTATYTTNALAAGSHTITAAYQSNGNDAASSGSVTETIGSPTFSLTANGSAGTYSLTVQRGFASQLTIGLTPSSSFSGTVAFSCTGLPANTSCTFTPATLTIAAGSSAQSVTLLLRTSTLSSANQGMPGSTGTQLALAFSLPGMLLAGLGLRSKRVFGNSRLLLLGILLLGFAGSLGIMGCGSNSTPNFTNTTTASPGTTTFNVVATSATVTQTIPVSLTIQ